MTRITRHIRVGLALIIAVLTGAFPIYASASTPQNLVLTSTPDVFITEFQTNGGSAAQEFIELYNNTDSDIAFNDPSAAANQWKIEFFNSTAVKAGAPAWTTAPTASNSITLTGTIPAHDYYVLSSTGYEPGAIEPDQVYAPTSSHLMTDTGGAVQLLSTTSTPTVTTVHDRVMWLAPAAGTALPAGVLASPSSGKSLQRVPNDNTEYVDAGNTLAAFGPADTVTPYNPWQAPLPVVTITPDPVVDPVADPSPVTDPTTDPTADEPTDGDSDSSDPVTAGTTTTSTTDTTGLSAPVITELLPNPASPLTDAADEFIELYNPNSVAFDLKGYSLEVGTTTLHSFTFTDDTMLPPTSYQAFYSADTKLSLSNTSGQARLRDPSNTVVSQTDPYATAADGQAWVLASDGLWKWSTAATPGVANVIATPTATVKTSSTTATKAIAATKTTAAKVATTKKATTTKAKGTTTTKKAAAKKTTKKKTVATKTATINTAAVVTPKAPIHSSILVGVAVAAVLYGLYEYRHDISSKFFQFRANRAARRGGRRQAAW